MNQLNEWSNLFHSQLEVDRDPDRVLDQLGFEHHWSHDVLLHCQDTKQSDPAVWLEAADWYCKLVGTFEYLDLLEHFDDHRTTC